MAYPGSVNGRVVPTLEDVLADWRARIAANREQVDHVREVEDAADYYASRAQGFRPIDPRHDTDPIVAAVQSLVQPGETWLDIGAGGGRYALPLAVKVGEVIALDPSQSMLNALREGASASGIENVRIINARWPLADAPTADVALAANVLYDIDDVEGFLEAMEASARRLCVVVMAEFTPPTPVDRLWPDVHGIERAELPALAAFETLLLARGTLFEVRLPERTPTSYASHEDALAQARRHTWVRPGGEKDQRLQVVLRERLVEQDGRYALGWAPVRVGVVSWRPR